jgi:L-threonylcarbamoyladenylate synthase
MEVLATSPAAITKAIDMLRGGGIVIHATETCYGIACDMSNVQAVERLFAIKKRPADKPVSALFASIESAKEYLTFNDAALQLARTHLPGPLTIILPLKPDAPQIYPVPTQLSAGSVGLRISSHPTAMTIAEGCAKPISTTSANIHGQPETYSYADILAQLQDGELPDLILDDGVLAKTPPSTIVAFDADVMRVVRQGSVRL